MLACATGGKLFNRYNQRIFFEEYEMNSKSQQHVRNLDLVNKWQSQIEKQNSVSAPQEVIFFPVQSKDAQKKRFFILN